MPLKPDKKKGALSKKTAWFLGTVRYIEFAKEFKTMQDHLAYTILVTKLNINKYLTIKGIRSKFKQYRLVKFIFSEKATKIWLIFHSFLTLLSCIKLEDGPNFCGLLRISEL